MVNAAGEGNGGKGVVVRAAQQCCAWNAASDGRHGSSRQDPGGQGYIIGPLVLGFTTRYVNIPTRDGSCRMFRIYRTYGIYGMPRNVCTDARMSSLTVKTPPRASPARCGPTLRPSPYYTCVDAP
eukprot:116109-Chlamydomonas_euryale.AAC.3